MKHLLVVSHPAVLPVNQHLYRELRARGWDVKLVVPARWHHEYGAIDVQPLPGMEGAFIRRQVLAAGKPQRHLYISPPSLLLRRLRPDVLFLEEESFSLCAAQWGRAATRLDIPFGVQAAENLDRPLPFLVRRSRATVLAHASFVAARSPAAAALARQWGATGVTELVPHSVPPWKPQQRRPHETFTIGFAGRLVEAKGVTDLLTAFRLMKVPGRLVLVGDGPLARQVASEPGVELWAGYSHDNMPAAYAQMDVLVLPSRRTPAWEEQFGRVLVEALSCGVPVIGSDTGEIPWVVKTTGGGWLTPTGDATALAALLDQVARDEVGRRVRAEAGCRAADDLFSLRAAADQLVALLTEVTAHHRATAC